MCIFIDLFVFYLYTYTSVNETQRFLADDPFGSEELLQRGLKVKQLFITGLVPKNLLDLLFIIVINI
jgi:hypothetical protein